MKQAKIDSFMEAVTNTLVGFLLSGVVMFITTQIMGMDMTLRQGTTIVLVFTGVSITRNYVLRRLFDGRSVWETIRG